MKKLVIMILVLLLFAAGGGGAYYYFFMMNEETLSEPVDDNGAQPVSAEMDSQSSAQEVPSPPRIQTGKTYYVTSSRLNIRAYPESESSIRAVLYKGDEVTAKEVKGDWVRIGGYEVHPSGKDMAQWVHIDYLSASEPVITEEEKRNTTIALIKNSDDFLKYEDVFIRATQNLISSGQCKVEDFELLGGWVRSVTYKDQRVYFVYCAGTDRQNKVYLNVETQEIF
ncbi:hypothetical protein DI392_15710 [Vibrio albus]|uniref:SH3b domain-containing protein n=1 Tax=Vibrio albus TaxID=2200953 RepID=A0A2U3B6Z2_9VIBR|nr:SH3 domain-containing protein [Vibrio albus]PWI32495.1 hypothetical protein DI392_15710 [Vibrio albus]